MNYYLQQHECTLWSERSLGGVDSFQEMEILGVMGLLCILTVVVVP